LNGIIGVQKMDKIICTVILYYHKRYYLLLYMFAMGMSLLLSKTKDINFEGGEKK